VGNTEPLKGKRSEQVQATQINGSNRDGRCSCAGDEVSSNPAISRTKYSCKDRRR
jgi:hypothetical protein